MARCGKKWHISITTQPRRVRGVLSYMPKKIKTNEWNYNQIFFYKCKMVESKMAAVKLKMAIFPFRLNLERVCVMFYGSINPIESVKLPLVLIILTNPRWRHPRWRYPKWRHFVVLRRSTALSPQLHSTTILEGNRGNCRYHFESIILVVGRFQTFMNLLL